MIRNILALLGIILLFNTYTFAQLTGDNCSNPKAVSIVCPTTVSYTSETTSGYANDITSFGFSTPGNDRVYKITVPSGSVKILVSITSTTSSFYMFLTGNSCTPSSYTSYYVSGTTDNISIPISGSGPYYLWIDNTNSIDFTYSISFGVVTSTTTTDSRGNWGFDNSGCISPMTKTNLNIKYNGTQMYVPITYSPLSSSGVICSSIFLKNTTGQEGVKTFTFQFGSSLASISPTASSMSGFYNSGTWNATTSGNTVSWTFSDAAGLGYGDFTGSPSSCLEYSFCFNMTPLSNDPIGTNIDVTAYPDGRGSPTSYGCCATSNNCSVGATTASSAISAAFNDPPLPAINFDLNIISENKTNTIYWVSDDNKANITGFEIQRSYDSNVFHSIGFVKSTNEIKNYSFKDFISYSSSEVYYRIKLIQKDGSEIFSSAYEVNNESKEIIVLPQPVNDYFTIKSYKPFNSIIVKDVLDNFNLKFNYQNNNYDISSLPSGIYFIHINFEDQVVVKKVIKE